MTPLSMLINQAVHSDIDFISYLTHSERYESKGNAGWKCLRKDNNIVKGV